MGQCARVAIRHLRRWCLTSSTLMLGCPPRAFALQVLSPSTASSNVSTAAGCHKLFSKQPLSFHLAECLPFCCDRSIQSTIPACDCMAVCQSRETSSMCWLCRAWEAMRSCTRCRVLVVLYRGTCVAHLGSCNDKSKPGQAQMGDLCRRAATSGDPNNLANLARYPGEALCLSYVLFCIGVRAARSSGYGLM